MTKATSKIPYIIIAISLISCLYFSVQLLLSRATWEDKKLIYKDLIELVGEISAHADNTEKLKELKVQFDAFFGGKMILGEANNEELLSRMMILNTAYENQIEGKKDIYSPNGLRQSCQKLIKQLSIAVDDGDSKYLKNIFLSLGLGLVFLMIYFLIKILVVQKKKKENLHQIPQEVMEVIKIMISRGDTNDALNQLEHTLREHKSSRLDELLIIKGHFNTIVKKRNMHLIDRDEEKLELSRTNKAIFDFLNEGVL